MRLIDHFPHYLHKSLGRPLGALYIFVALQEFALAMMILFEPVFLYRQGYSVSRIAFFYVTVYLLYIVLIPFGGKFVGRFGPPRAIALSTLFLVGYYVTLMLTPNLPFMMWVAPIFFALQKTFYWPGFHTDFIRASKSGERGREFSGLYALSSIMYIIGPVIGGLVITSFGYTTLFTIGAVVIFIASLPLLFTPVPPIRETQSYRELFKLPWSHWHRRTTLSYFGFGESLLHVYIWPIYLSISFVTIERLGGLMTLATLFTAFVTLIIGKYFDRGKWRFTLRAGAGLALLTWLTRPWIHTVPAVFSSAVAGQLSQNISWVTSSDVAYERALQEKNDIGRSILLEQGLSFGKVLAGLLLAGLALVYPPFTVAFILGAGFTLFYFLFR
ncbi:MAG: MFS transporter [Patescibacteria group bacterium]